MTVRYRIRTSAGQELSFASREMFEDFVRSGDLSPDDLVYDGETGSWSPARTHPTVLNIQYELEAEAEGAVEADAGSGSSDPSRDAVPESAPGDGAEAPGQEEAKAAEPTPDDSFGLSLAPEDDAASDVGSEAGSEEAGEETGDAAEVDLNFDLALTDELSPEEEQRAFLEQLEAERQGDLDAGPSIRDSLSGFTTADTLAPRPEPPPPRTPDPPPRPRSSRPRGSGGPDRRSSKGGRKPSAPPSKGGGLGRLMLRVVLLVLLAGGGYVAFQLLAAGPEPEPEVDDGEVAAEAPVEPAEETPEPTPPAVEPEPTPEPVIPSTQAAVRERAQERYLTSTQTALRDLQPIPDVWPEGPYLTAPSEHPEVLDVWQAYRSTIRAVREADQERYRTAYIAALDDAAVPEEARQDRIDGAMEAFATTAELRAAHFDRVETLATAAIQSHEALLEAEGLIVYDATGASGPSQGVGQGTSGLNDESQLLLDQVVELLTAALDADGEGPGSAENVREWVWDGFLDAATR